MQKDDLLKPTKGVSFAPKETKEDLLKQQQAVLEMLKLNSEPAKKTEVNTDNKPQMKGRPLNMQGAKHHEQPTEQLITTMPKNLAGSVKVMFLGGVGEVGKNITVLEYGNDIIVIDSGLAFPSDDMPGVDIIIPDFSYLKINKAKIKALLITHGHEDHIGSVPYFLKELGENIPVYGADLTLALIEGKLMEHKIKLNGTVVKPRQMVKIGAFHIEFIKVNHSIAGSLAMSINTPVGTIFHTGDFKIDYTPVDGEVIDIGRIAEIGKKGVKLLLCESTNVLRPGFTPSETTLGKTLEDLFVQYKKERLFVATFASNTFRLIQIIGLAEKYGRKLVFTGRSMVNVSDICIKLGYLKMDKNNIIEVEKINKYKPEELCIITTGSQGENLSALSRMATGDFNKIQIGEGDVVIFSASPIPGNEKAVNKVENMLFRRGVVVVNNEMTDTHVSGHAREEEIKAMHALLKPQFFIPVHGEYKHLMVHRNLAVKLGTEKRNTIIPDIGFAVEINKQFIKKIGMVPAGFRLVDGLGIGESSSNVLRERKQLSEDGVCVVILGIDMVTGEITTGPDIITRGLVYSDEANNLVGEAKEIVRKVISNTEIKSMDEREIREVVKRALFSYFIKKTQRRPIILTILVEG